MDAEVTQCENVHCKEPAHIKATDDLIIEVLEAVDNAAKDNLYNATQNSVEKRLPIPGWSEEVKPFQETVFFSGTKYGNRMEDPSILNYIQ